MADTEKIIRKKYDVPIWHKSNLTIDEAVEYTAASSIVSHFLSHIGSSASLILISQISTFQHFFWGKLRP